MGRGNEVDAEEIDMPYRGPRPLDPPEAAVAYAEVDANLWIQTPGFARLGVAVVAGTGSALGRRGRGPHGCLDLPEAGVAVTHSIVTLRPSLTCHRAAPSAPHPMEEGAAGAWDPTGGRLPWTWRGSGGSQAGRSSCLIGLCQGVSVLYQK